MIQKPQDIKMQGPLNYNISQTSGGMKFNFWI